MNQRVENYQYEVLDLDGWKVGVTSYRLGDEYVCVIDNVDPGARLTRRVGATREAAVSEALVRAREMLSRTRTFSVG